MTDATRDKGSDHDTLGSAFSLYKPVRLDQLAYEITEAMHWREEPVLTGAGDPGAAGAEDPITVYIDRADVDDGVFVTTVGAHQANPGWIHPTLAAVTLPPPPPFSLADLAAKVAEGQGLTPDEQAAAISGLVADWRDRTTT